MPDKARDRDKEDRDDDEPAGYIAEGEEENRVSDATDVGVPVLVVITGEGPVLFVELRCASQVALEVFSPQEGNS